MAKQRYFKVLYAAGAFIDDNHYALDEIVPYNPSEKEDKEGKPLWGQEVDQHGNEIGRKADPHAVSDKQANTFVKAQTGIEPKAQPAAPAKNELTEEQKAQILEALPLLEEGNDQHWTKAGKPKPEAVTSILGFTVTAKDLETAAPDFKRPAKAA